MPAIYHVKEEDNTFEGAVTHITESTSSDDVVWHCQKADANYDGAIFHVKWAEQNFDGPVQRVVGIARVIETVVSGVPPLSLPDAVAGSLVSLKAFGGTEQRNLPAEYTQLEYLGSNSQAYIDTGIAGGKDTLTIECKFMYNTFVAYGGIYGNYVSDYHNGIRCILANSENKIITNNTTICTTTGNTELNCAISQIHTVISKHDTMILDGVATSIQNTVTGTENANNIALFNRSITNPNTSRDIGLRVYGFKIYDADVLVSNLIPCRRKSDSVLGMYDTVSGNFLTNQGTGTFTTGGEAVPTPDAPMDIVCNNGVLKARHQSGLPLGYTLLDYIQSSGSQYIDTLRVPNNNDIIEQKFKKNGTNTATCSWYGSMPSSSEITPRIGVGSFNSQSVLKLFAGSNYTGIVANADAQVHTLRFQATGRQKLTYTLDGVTNVLDASTSLLPIDMYEPAVELTSYLFARHGENGVQIYDNEGTRIYYHREYLANGTLALNMVPCKNASNVVGMYDTVTGTFFTNQGTGDFTAGDPVSDPVEIYTDGTVETIAIKDDQNTTVSTATCEDLLSVGTYTDEQEVISGSVTRKVGVKVLDGTENWILSGGVGVWANFQSITGVAFGTTSAICSHSAYAGADVSVANMNQNEFSLFANGNIAFKNANTTSTSDWTTFLAQQYAAGTPVIIVYPLATATTETVTGQPMATAQGDNTAEITQASMSGLELEIHYMKQGS